MTTNDVYTFECKRCGYSNTYTRNEVMRKGKEEAYRNPKIVRYSVPCKNPKSPACSERRMIGIVQEEK